MLLDMFPYTTHARNDMASPPTHERPLSYMYELSSVVVHKGKIDSGHYVCYCRENNDWFVFDDSKVVKSNDADVLGAEAYLLFYIVKDLD